MVSLPTAERIASEVSELMTDLREAIDELRTTIEATRRLADRDSGRQVIVLPASARP